MPFWPEATPPRLLLTIGDRERRLLVGELIASCIHAFPRISYSIDWKSDTCDGRAWTDSTGQHVRLYGGLARHVRIGRAGLMVALAHEIGHHVGEGPRHRHDPTVASEAVADRWAMHGGLSRIFGATMPPSFWRKGRRELAEMTCPSAPSSGQHRGRQSTNESDKQGG